MTMLNLERTLNSNSNFELSPSFVFSFIILGGIFTIYHLSGIIIIIISIIVIVREKENKKQMKGIVQN
jgi:drug/metabolite transporter (DMT)-like permease